jgi:hypothetical protein
MSQSLSFKDRRANTIELIANLRAVRKLVRNGKLTKEVFDRINGEDYAIEGLVGHDVVFNALTDTELRSLRREIIAKANENEYLAFESLRNAYIEYFAAIDNLIASHKDAGKAALLNEAAVWATTDKVTDKSIFTADGAQYAADALQACSEFLNDITPVLCRVYDAEDIPEEQIVENPEIEGNPEPAAPSKEEQPVEPKVDDNPDHQVIQDPAEDDDNAADAVKDACLNNRSLGQSVAGVRQGTLVECGYNTPAKAVETINLLNTVENEFIEAVEDFRAVIPCSTCVTDDLVHGNAKFFDAMEAVVGLIDKGIKVVEAIATSRSVLSAALVDQVKND